MKGNYNEIREGDALQQLKEIDNDSIDLLCTDPPYGYSFMGKEWDKAVVSVDVWRECLRVLKAGAFAFVMSAPRQDVLSRMIVNLQDAGFRTDFTSIYWTYASGFPKAANVSKLADKRNGTTPDQSRQFANYIKTKREESKISLSDIDNYVCNGSTNYSWFEGRPAGQRLPKPEEYTKIKSILKLDNRFDEFIGEAEREIIAKKHRTPASQSNTSHEYGFGEKTKGWFNITKSATEIAKRLDGSYAGFQPKPAVEVVLTVMKPLSEKTFVDQALSNGKGITWLDDCRIPFQNGDGWNRSTTHKQDIRGNKWNSATETYELPPQEANEKGRFPANLLVLDDALNDGKITKSTGGITTDTLGKNVYGKFNPMVRSGAGGYQDQGSYSRYFDLDAWYDNRAQFIITPKASASERNKGLENSEKKDMRFFKSHNGGGAPIGISKTYPDGRPRPESNKQQNHHPTVKPLKLMSYLITMGSRENDIVLDPFCGSGTTLIAAEQLNRKWIGIELNTEYAAIARKRIEPYLIQQKLL